PEELIMAVYTEPFMEVEEEISDPKEEILTRAETAECICRTSASGTTTMSDARWEGIERTYTAEDVERLRGSVVPEHTLARLGAERLWELLHGDEPVTALGALTGGQAAQMVKAGLQAIYLSGWQVAADANLAGATYPD